MNLGMRKPSLAKSISARTSLKRVVRHRLGFKAPRGMGWITNPKKAAYNRVYNRTSFSIGKSRGAGNALIITLLLGIFIVIVKGIFSLLYEFINLISSLRK